MVSLNLREIADGNALGIHRFPHPLLMVVITTNEPKGLQLWHGHIGLLRCAFCPVRTNGSAQSITIISAHMGELHGEISLLEGLSKSKALRLGRAYTEHGAMTREAPSNELRYFRTDERGGDNRAQPLRSPLSHRMLSNNDCAL